MDRDQFGRWLQGIISRVSSQQTFFSAIYEPISSANNTADNLNNRNINNAQNNTKENDERPSGLRLASVIGKSTVALEASSNNNSNNKEDNTANNTDHKSEPNEDSERVYVWGQFHKEAYYRPELFTGLLGRTVVQVACGADHNVFLTDQGKVFCSGQNFNYQLGNGTIIDNASPNLMHQMEHLNVTKICCGSSFSCALTDTGNVIMWGTLRHGDKYGTLVLSEPAVVKPLKRVNIIDIASGGAHVLALGSDGTLYTWGNPMFGRLGRLVAANTEADPRLPAPVAALSGLRVSQIDCGEQHSILVTNKGVVYAWGRNDYEQCIESSSTQQLDLPLQVDLSSVLRPDDVVKQVRAGFRFSACRTSNRVFTWGGYPMANGGPKEVKLDETSINKSKFNIVDMVTGSTHCLLLSDTGSVYSFGVGEYGQTGQNDPGFVDEISHVPITKRIDKIAAGGKTSIAVHGSLSSVLGDNMSRLINNQKLFSDILIKTSDEKLIPAHRAILSTRSDILFKMIVDAEQNHSGSAPPVIDVSEYTSLQINALLVYLYTSRVLSDNLNGDELQKILHESKSRTPPGAIVSLPSILSSDMSRLLEWQTTKLKDDLGNDLISNVLKNSLPVAGRWSDVKLVLGDKEISAHKAILCANSEYFRLMLTGGMKESQMERIQIRDEVPFEAFVATLQFIYTDIIDVDVNLALDVLPLASEYNLQRLKQKCEGIIEKQVDILSVAYVWQVARFYSATRLESFCLDLLVPQFETVKHTEAFNALSPEEQKTLSAICSKQG